MPAVERALDHLFLFVSGEDEARRMMSDAGLRVNYARQHPGQGTANICACLDDVFIELLWADGSAISEESERISLGARCRGQGSPLGVSWRGTPPDGCAAYAPAYLPKGVTIPVMAQSLAPAMPFVFQTPGGAPPIDRDPALVGDRQQPHFERLGRCEIVLERTEAVTLVTSVLPELDVKIGPSRLMLEVLRDDGSIGLEIDWSFHSFSGLT